MECGCYIKMGEDVNGPECFRSVDRKARKQHKCSECGRTVEKGETYRYESGIWDGEPDSHKTCQDCLSLRNESFCSWCYGTIWADFRETINNSSGDDVNWSAIGKLTPTARDKALEIIERVWGSWDGLRLEGHSF